MLINTKELQVICKKILDAIDSSSDNDVSEVIELRASQGVLVLNATNMQYYVSASIKINTFDELYAVISAKIFLKLISQITTNSLTLSVKDNVLIVEANGQYKFPFVYDKDGKLIKPNRIEISQVTSEMTITRDVLVNILKFNSKQSQKSGVTSPVHKMCYVDEEGAITFSSGACLTYFRLDAPVRVLLNEKTVKLFKLFTFDFINFTVGFNSLPSGDVQTVVRFKDEQVELTSIVNADKSMIDSVPVKSIRKLAESDYAYRIVVDKTALMNALSRLSLFSKDIYVMSFTNFEFVDGKLVIKDTSKQNSETIDLLESDNLENYSFTLVTDDLLITLNTVEEDYVVLKFGNGRAVMTEQTRAKNILPEASLK